MQRFFFASLESRRPTRNKKKSREKSRQFFFDFAKKFSVEIFHIKEGFREIRVTSDKRNFFLVI